MSAENEYVVVGHFEFVDDVIGAVAAVKNKSPKWYRVFSPFPCHEIEDEVYKGKARSPVRMFTLLGALTGVSGAFLMTIWMSIDYPLRTSAKEIISIPAFVVIGFECTILLGALFTLLSMFHFSRIPNLMRWPDFRPNFSEGTFGVTVRVPEAQKEVYKELLTSHGAHKVEVQYVR
jgi:hypothetical protein